MADNDRPALDWLAHPNTDIGGLDLGGADVRSANLAGIRVRDAMLVGARLNGVIAGMRLNDVEVAPLIEAELDRRDPDRVLVRSQEPDDLRTAWDIVCSRWDRTVAAATAAGDDAVRTSVDGEWSLRDTLRHLVFVTDAWILRVVDGDPAPYHRLGLPPSFLPAGVLGLDASLDPDLDAVLAARQARQTAVTKALDGLDRAGADRLCPPNSAPGYPPTTEVSVGQALRTVIGEEWAHHGFAARDLATLGVVA